VLEICPRCSAAPPLIADKPQRAPTPASNVVVPAREKQIKNLYLSLHAHETKAPVANSPLKPRKWTVNLSQSVCKIVPTCILAFPTPRRVLAVDDDPVSLSVTLCCWKRKAVSSCRPPVVPRPSTLPQPICSTASSPTCACPGSPAPSWPVPSARPHPARCFWP